jgi:hypothetical protein
MVTKMRIIRRDFVEDDSCYFCHRQHTLTTKIAYIIGLENGEETQCGPCCAKNHFSKIIVTNTPDFTRATIECNSKESNGKGDNSNNNINSTKELEYLHLRCKYLDDFADSTKIKYQPLMDIYNKNNFEINDEDKKHINNIMNKLKNTKLSYENLMACYQAKKIINMWIKQENNNIDSLNFAKKLYERLKKYCYFTVKQVIGLNNWIINMEKIPKINGKWFFKPENNATNT